MPDSSLAQRASRALHVAAGDVVVVRAPVAPLNGEPRVSSAQVTQALGGHALEVLGRDREWLRVRGGDDYEGWVHGGYVAEASAVLGASGARWYGEAALSLDCVVQGPWGRRRLPLGAVLLPRELLVAGEAVALGELARRFPTRGTSIAGTAVERFMGTSYQWGGLTPWGADCSGVVQTAFGLHGVALPRDAWQQALLGERAPGDAGRPAPHALLAGDLLFFSDRPDGRITHVAIALGEGRIVHAALGRGGQAVELLDDAEDPYVATLRANFREARRLAIGD